MVTVLTPRPLLALVLVVLLMAGVAGRFELLSIQMAFMTAPALERPMFSEERVLRIPIVVEGDRLPVLFHVTALAFLPIVSLVFIVFPMAGQTRRWGFLLVQVPLMATLTFRGLVLPFERILRVAVMIERDRFPILFYMAGFTPPSKETVMLIVFLVTTETKRRGPLFVKLPLMAALTFRGLMFALERVLGVTIMIERDRFPILFYMARFAS